jgi:putative flavoprotein involved in K+ transport
MVLASAETTPEHVRPNVEPVDVARAWVDRFVASFAGQGDVADLVVADAWWRDLLALSWDLHSWRGRERIADEVKRAASNIEITNARIDEHLPVGWEPWAGTEVIGAAFRFDTPRFLAVGHVRLVNVGDEFRAITVLTQMDELVNRREQVGDRRPWGEPDGAKRGEVAWHVRRAELAEFPDSEPDVVILGGGQAGLSLAARLGQLGVPTLVVERNARIGDNWRHRYPTLSLHDPVWLNALPYLDYPQTFPVFLPRDKFADWLENYANALDLNVWTGASVGEAGYDEAGGRWSVPVLKADGTERVLRPKHYVLATGLHGEPLRPAYPGQQTFPGEIVHSATFTGGGEDRLAGRKAIVVGGGVSAHDVVEALWEQGADVTMVRRSPTIVVTRSSFMAPLKSPGALGGPAAAYADLAFGAVPWQEKVTQQARQVRRWKEWDAEMHSRLGERGYEITFGPGDAGTLALYVQGGRGGFYIDVGALELIASGEIDIKQGVTVEAIDGSSVQLSDGSTLEADLIVQATGYTEMGTAARRFVGDVIDKVGELHHLDSDGELRGIWRRTGVPGLWFMVGNIQMSRYYSKVLALQIAAQLDGLLPDE